MVVAAAAMRGEGGEGVLTEGARLLESVGLAKKGMDLGRTSGCLTH